MPNAHPGAGGALVTGAGRGLGAAIARALAARGHAVHVTDVDAGAAERVAAELGDAAWASALDVTDAEACAAAARATAERAGSLAVWVNNAGILMTGVAWGHSAAERARLFAINVDGTVNGTLAALDVMRPAGRGHVVNVVSLAGLVAAPGETLYSATKHAALAFSVGTLMDLRRTGVKGIHVSALCPDGIATPMLAPHADDPDAWPSWSGTMLTPERVAAAAVELLDRPRPIRSVPRWRGALVRVFASAPGPLVRLLPVLIADARRRQRAWAARAAG